MKHWRFVRFEENLGALYFKETTTKQDYYMREAKTGTLMWNCFNSNNLEVVDRVDLRTKILCIDIALKWRPQDVYKWFQQLKKIGSKDYLVVRARLRRKYNILCDKLREQEEIIKDADSKKEEGQPKIKSAQARIEQINREMPNPELISILIQK